MNYTIFIILLVVYLGIMSGLAYYGYRKTASEADYLVAGRNINPIIMALSYGATMQSTSSLIGFGGVAANLGYGLLWLSFLNIVIGVFVAFVIFGKKIRKLSLQSGTYTLPSMLGEHYNSKFITVFSGAMIFLFMPAYTSVVLIGGSRFMEQILSVNFNVALIILAVIVGIYVFTGGLKAVMYTDAFTALIILVGMIVFLVVGYHSVGGIFEGHKALTEMKDLIPNSLREAGSQGWTSMPSTGSSQWWTMVSTMIMGVGIGVVAQPQLAMRSMSVKNDKSLNRSVLVGGLFIFFLASSAYMIGPLSNVYFHDTTGKIAIDVAGGNTDLIIPSFIESIMPNWFLYLFTFTLLSLAISTISSLIHVQASAFGEDIFKTFGIRSLFKAKISLSRFGVIIGVILAIVLAYLLPGGVIAQATSFFMGICAAGFIPTMIGAFYWKNSTKAAAISSIVVGFSVSIVGFLFFHQDEAEAIGLSKAMFGHNTVLGFPVTHIDPLFYSLPLSAIVFVVVNFITWSKSTKLKDSSNKVIN